MGKLTILAILENLQDTGVLEMSKPNLKINPDIDVKQIKSTTLLRLIEEVKNDTPDTIRAFDRIHVRHNR